MRWENGELWAAIHQRKEMMSIEQELAAWRKRFAQHEYRPQDDCIALKLGNVRHGCHVDLYPGQKPDGCVFDQANHSDCNIAMRLNAENKGKLDCEYWKPITEDV